MKAYAERINNLHQDKDDLASKLEDKEGQLQSALGIITITMHTYIIFIIIIYYF
jgi:hypothetical protein